MSQSNSPPSSQPDEPSSADPQALAEYSRALHEWTSQKWLQAVRESEERRALLEQEYHTSNLRSESQPQAQQQVQQAPVTPQQPIQASVTPQQPTQVSSSAGTETIGVDNRTTQSPSDRSKAS